MTTYLAIDIGGTKIAAGLVDEHGSVRDGRRVPTGPDPWPALATLSTQVAAGANCPVAGIGIGCGGPMDQARGIVAPMNIPAWRDGFALVERVGALLPGVPVRLHNDAVCFAAAEYWNGAAQGTRNALGMVVSTGIGGGLVLDGRLLHGTTGHAGHVGHIVVAPDGPPCGCGGRGCVEAIARGPALVAWARQHGWTGPQAAVDDGPALAADAAAGNPVAVAAYRRGGAAVGRMLAGLTAALELQVVVFGGGVAAAGALLLDPVRATYDTHARMPFQRSLRITTSSLPDAGLVGAAALFAAPQLTGPW